MQKMNDLDDITSAEYVKKVDGSLSSTFLNIINTLILC